jgi:hypothetical protein
MPNYADFEAEYQSVKNALGKFADQKMFLIVSSEMNNFPRWDDEKNRLTFEECWLRFRTMETPCIYRIMGDGLVSIDIDDQLGFETIASVWNGSTLTIDNPQGDPRHPGQPRKALYFIGDFPHDQSVKKVKNAGKGDMDFKREKSLQSIFGYYRKDTSRAVIPQGSLVEVPKAIHDLCADLVMQASQKTVPSRIKKSYAPSHFVPVPAGVVPQDYAQENSPGDWHKALEVADFFKAQLSNPDSLIHSYDSWRDIVWAINSVNPVILKEGEDFPIEHPTYKLCSLFTYDDHKSHDQLRRLLSNDKLSGKKIGTAINLAISEGFKPSWFTELDLKDWVELNLRFNSKTGWYLWDRKYWKLIGFDQSYCVEIAKLYYQQRGTDINSRRVNHFLSEARIYGNIPEPFDGRWIAFNEGCLDTITSQFVLGNHREVNPTLFFNVDYLAPYNPPSKWLEHLSRLFDSEVATELIRAFLATTIRRDRWAQKFLALVGAGGTGKSIVGEVFERIMGAGSATSKISEMCSSHGLEPLVGKSFIIITEVSSSERLAEIEPIKAIVGEDSVLINPKNRPGFSTKINASLLVLSNSFLQFRDDGGSVSRRLIQIPVSPTCTQEASEKLKLENPRFKEEIFAEIPQIIKWAMSLDNYREVLMQKVKYSNLNPALLDQAISQDTLTGMLDELFELTEERYKIRSNSVSRIIADAYRISGIQDIPKSKRIKSTIELWNKLREGNIKDKRDKIGVYYTGFKLKPSAIVWLGQNGVNLPDDVTKAEIDDRRAIL